MFLHKDTKKSIISVWAILTILLCFMPVNDASARKKTGKKQTVTLTFDDGSVYTGQIADSLFNGHGKMVYADSTSYEGDWKNGLWEGKGELHFADGDCYIGDFKEHKMNGNGTYWYANGDWYDGEWKNGQFNGTGRLNMNDGSFYFGEWKDDMKDGFGWLYVASENKDYLGQFRYDYYVGNATFEDFPDDIKLDIISLEEEPHFSFNGSYGFKQMLDISLLFEGPRNYGGFTIGFNVHSYSYGASVDVTDDDGNNMKLVKWDQSEDEVEMRGDYTFMSIYADYGHKWKKVALGCSAGVGLTQSYKICRAKDDTVFDRGTIYYKQKVTGASFGYRLYSRFLLKTFKYQEEFPNIFESPGHADVILNLGYGNLDGFFVGFGLRF
ncbi:MAG: hypothetical protein IK006_01010 [Bacteroidaceae bacterium]|nr:hypothetical protein [Bacteroidaceae bacterium]